MSVACVQNYLSNQFQTFQITNGECRFLRAPGADETDAQGFVSSEFVARTVGYLPCSWTPVNADKTSEDSDVALQVLSTAAYEITIGQSSAGTFLPSDLIELRTKPGDPASLMTCEIVRRVNQNNIAWLIRAVNLDDNK